MNNPCFWGRDMDQWSIFRSWGQHGVSGFPERATLQSLDGTWAQRIGRCHPVAQVVPDRLARWKPSSRLHLGLWITFAGEFTKIREFQFNKEWKTECFSRLRRCPTAQQVISPPNKKWMIAKEVPSKICRFCITKNHLKEIARFDVVGMLFSFFFYVVNVVLVFADVWLPLADQRPIFQKRSAWFWRAGTKSITCEAHGDPTRNDWLHSWPWLHLSRHTLKQNEWKIHILGDI